MKRLEKKVNGIEDRVYSSLSPAERFRLGVQAAANQNEAERERLVKTCPKKQYSMNDAAFVDRVEAAQDLALLFVLEVAPRERALKLLAAFEEYLKRLACQAMVHMEMAYENGFRAAGGGALGEGNFSKDLPPSLFSPFAVHRKQLGEIRKSLGAETRGLWEAFGTVCREGMRLDPEDVLAAFCPQDLDCFDELQGYPVNEELRDEMREIMHSTWVERAEADSC